MKTAAYYLVVGDKDIILAEEESASDAYAYAATFGGRVLAVMTDGSYRYI